MNQRQAAIDFLLQDTAFALCGVQSRRQRATRATSIVAAIHASVEGRPHFPVVRDAVAHLLGTAKGVSRSLDEVAETLEHNIRILEAMRKQPRRGARTASRGGGS